MLIRKSIIILIILAFILGLTFHNTVAQFKYCIPYLLGIIMFGVGVNLKKAEVVSLQVHKSSIIIIVLVKFIVLSLTAYLLSKVFHLSPPMLIGLVILGSCPGGTAANVYALLSSSNLALTIVLTLITTLLAPLAIPLFTYIYLHETIHIPYLSMFLTSTYIVVLPIVAGVVIKLISKKYKSNIARDLSYISIICIALVVAIVVALNQAVIIALPIIILVVVIIFCIFSLCLGFLLSKLFKFNKQDSRSIIFEFGMLDSGLGAALSVMFFSPVTALPAALYSVVQNIIGPAIVSYMNYKDSKINK